MSADPQDPNQPKSWWQAVIDAVTSPLDFLQHWSSKSPLLTVLAVVFLLQPVISTGIGIFHEFREVKHVMNPANRPVTEQELDIVNQKIDFMQQLIVEEVNNKKPANPSAQLEHLQGQLNQIQKKLDNAYTQQQAPK